MKKTFTTIDVLAIVEELKLNIIGLRVNQIYDIDHKTYLIKLQKPDHKVVLLLESASRIHTTDYDWPKSPAPSGFAMKLRKHLRNKRLENVEQLGVDRIVDLTFGSGEAAHHLIIELYDRGNIVLTDGEYNILNVLRPRKEGEDTKIIVHEKYPIESARKARDPPSLEQIRVALLEAKDNIALKKILNPMLDCGGGMLDHELLRAGFPHGTKVTKEFKTEENIKKIYEAVYLAQSSIHQKLKNVIKKGYIIKKLIKRPQGNGSLEDAYLFEEFHPQLYSQHAELPYDELITFNKACDEFFSKLEANELDKKAAQKEKEALKKLENVKKDHERRLQELQKKQEGDMEKAQLIELNQQLVEGALLVVRSAVANQIDWRHIQELLDEAQAREDPIACAIRALKLETNTITLWLSNPYDYDENDMLLDSDEEREAGTESRKMRPMAIDINLDLSALANARKYYNMKRQAARKEQKTIDASFKAIKSAEKKTQQTLKEVSTIANINKARKVHWFEKFLWFISSENYLAIGGRDSQQNEQVVKRHLRPKDIYVHADLHGAASIIIKNPTGGVVPPRTLHEAGIMALCYSRAWDEKVVTSAWWVWGQQVSKTAPAGEYLTTGAFMVRGKKNFLPPSHLVYGFGFLFRLEEDSVARHEGERKVRVHDEELSAAISDALEKLSANSTNEKEEEIFLDDDNDDEEKLEDIEEEPTIKIEGSPKLEVNSRAFGEKSEDEESESAENEQKREDEFEEQKIEVEEMHNEDCGVKTEQLLTDSNTILKEKVNETETKQQEFPDTDLEMSHLKGEQFTIKVRTTSATSQPQTSSLQSNKEERSRDARVIFLGDDKPLIISHAKSREKKENAKNKKMQDKFDPVVKEKEEKSNANPGGGIIKRGQKGKMKKMKKYKDQDEEERELRMQLLQSAGNKKEPKKEKSGKKSMQVRKKPERKVNPLKEETVSQSSEKDLQDPIDRKADKKGDAEENNEENEDEDVVQVSDDLSVLNALTAIPLQEDELLYAVPVCAPYTSMTNFKFKVKLTPGPGKKGKACKTALSLFLADRTASNREKDLLRAIKDHDLAKNLPGKVKVSAPNISRIKK